MEIKTVKYKGQSVPKYITTGNHTRFIKPFAFEICNGKGLDIGCGKEEWKLPGAIAVDPAINPKYNAYVLPSGTWDYIYSSHCLEHLPNYVMALQNWIRVLNPGGVLFLYLPHPDCIYWRPWEMPTKKHLHFFTPNSMIEIFKSLNLKNIFCSERDLAFSFAIYGNKSND